MRGITSTSLSTLVALQFANADKAKKGLLMVIKVPKGFQALFTANSKLVQGAAGYDIEKEREVTLPHNTQCSIAPGGIRKESWAIFANGKCQIVEVSTVYMTVVLT
jgi:hypothetical protein